jgi:type VI secretion system Hcp family effector
MNARPLNRLSTLASFSEASMLRVLALVLVFSFLAVPAARAQIFLELIGQSQGVIQGESTFPSEENRIEVFAFSQGLAVFENPFDGTLQRSRSSVNISKVWDRSSIKLLRAQGTGEQMLTCILRFHRLPGASASLDRRMPILYLVVELTGARIESYSASGAGNVEASESMSLVFDAIRYTYVSTGDSFYDPLRGPGSGAELAREFPEIPEIPSDGFEFVLPDEGNVGIEITDMDGRWVTTLFDDIATGSGVVRWDATDASGRKVPAGIYTATVRTSGAEVTRRMVIGD